MHTSDMMDFKYTKGAGEHRPSLYLSRSRLTREDLRHPQDNADLRNGSKTSTQIDSSRNKNTVMK